MVTVYSIQYIKVQYLQFVIKVEGIDMTKGWYLTIVLIGCVGRIVLCEDGKCVVHSAEHWELILLHRVNHVPIFTRSIKLVGADQDIIG